ncbi:hypothetical protein SLS60_008467 [Paraconiothyrium brasiliense]|uniref:Uncharacterized protein n=1 Tax=Paraconiothyrium brasiliense TaxID=300254 RepID=A0ABR3R0N0_9PLEO
MTKAMPSHPRLTMSTEQAFVNMFRVTHTPHVDPDQDPTIAQVEAAREDYIVRLMDAMLNLTDIHDKLDKNGTYPTRVQMFEPAGNTKHGWYVGEDLVESRCHVLFEVIIDRCRRGFRGQVKEDLARNMKLKYGFVKDYPVPTADMTGNCQSRIEMVITVLHYWKTVCAEAINDIEHMFALANHPQIIWSTKCKTAESNDCKAKKIEELKAKVKEISKTQQQKNTIHKPSTQRSRVTAAHKAPLHSNPDSQLPASMPHIPELLTTSGSSVAGDPMAAANPFQNPTTGLDGPPLDSQGDGRGPNLRPHGLPSPHQYHAYPGKPTQDQHSPMHLTGATIGTFNAFAAPLNSGVGFDSMFRSGQYNNHQGSMYGTNVTGTQRGTTNARSWEPWQTATHSHGLSPASPSAVQGLHAAPRAQASGQFQQRHNAGFRNHMGAQDTITSQQLHEPYFHTAQPYHSFGLGHSAPPQVRAPSKRPPSQPLPASANQPAQSFKKPRTGEVTAAPQLQQLGTPESQAPPRVRDKVWPAPMPWPASIGAKLPASLIAAHNAAETEAETGTDSDDDSDEEEDSEDYPEYHKHQKDPYSDDDDYAADEDEPESDDDSKEAYEEGPESDGEHDADEVLHSFSR